MTKAEPPSHREEQKNPPTFTIIKIPLKVLGFFFSPNPLDFTEPFIRPVISLAWLSTASRTPLVQGIDCMESYSLQSQRKIQSHETGVVRTFNGR